MTKTLSAADNEYSVGQQTFTVDGTSATLSEAGTQTYINCIVSNTGTIASTAVFTDKDKTYTFSYPKTLPISANENPVSGPKMVKVTIAKDSQPKTNLGDSTFTVSSDTSKSGIDSCLTASGGELTQKSSATINGTKFTKLSGTEAATGNRYETTTYAIVKNNTCYHLETVIHWSVIENYAPNSGIKEFNKSAVQNILNGMVNSFKFL
jgi:hypothetical protein